MGMDLHRKQGEPYTGSEDFHCNMAGWTLLMDLADDGGWEPAGTIQFDDDGSPDPDWQGHYGYNDGQFVTSEDARAIGDAIDRARLADDSLAKRLADRHGEFVDQFVAYCRGGGFEIH